MFVDGPKPLGLRFQINSASLNFESKEWFSIPKLDKETTRKLNKEKEISADGLHHFYEFIEEEKRLGLTSYKERAEIQEKTQPVPAQKTFDVKG